jgi:dihydropyrimidinase
MSEFDLVIKNADVATAGDNFATDIGIKDGRIVSLAQSLDGGEVIDANGRLVTPGGIDSHCHIAQPSANGSVCADDFESGTRTAACGGTTTIIPFAVQIKGQSLRAAVEDYHASAEGKTLVDYAFHLIISDPTAQVLGQELPALIREGYTSFKIYTTYDNLKLNDGQILDVLALARREQAMVMVHAENGDIITWMTEQLEQRGMTEPLYHAVSRPGPVEREATHRAITLAEVLDTPILLVHVSAAEAAEQIRMAQTRGLKIYGETCPQYLFLSEDDLDKPGFEGAKCICSPPPRDPANQQAIWDGLANGTFQVYSSDHAPTRFDDPKGKKLNGEDASFRYVPNGVPGIETRLPMLMSAGVMEGRITINQFVALTATNAARLYGIYPRKGTIAIGSDADIVVWDTETKRTVRNEDLHHDVDYTPYEGMAVNAWPALTLSRGVVVWDGKAPLDAAGRGEFLVCDNPDTARPLNRFVSRFRPD